MRRNNPKRTSYEDRCHCEHQDHFTERYVRDTDGQMRKIKVARKKHRYLSVVGDGGWALYVGHVCKDCEETCMVGWMVEEHVCGDGDCRRA